MAFIRIASNLLAMASNLVSLVGSVSLPWQVIGELSPTKVLLDLLKSRTPQETPFECILQVSEILSFFDLLNTPFKFLPFVSFFV